MDRIQTLLVLMKVGKPGQREAGRKGAGKGI